MQSRSEHRVRLRSNFLSVWLKPPPFLSYTRQGLTGIDKRSSSHELYVRIQLKYTLIRRTCICFMRVVTLWYWRYHKKQACRIFFSFWRVQKAVNVFPDWSGIKIAGRWRFIDISVMKRRMVLIRLIFDQKEIWRISNSKVIFYLVTSDKFLQIQINNFWGIQ